MIVIRSVDSLISFMFHLIFIYFAEPQRLKVTQTLMSFYQSFISQKLKVRGHRSEGTPDGIRPGLGPAKGELGLALLRRWRVLGQELHDVRVLLVAAHAAFTDDVHDAGQDVASAAAEPTGGRGATRLALLTRVQNLQRSGDMLEELHIPWCFEAQFFYMYHFVSSQSDSDQLSLM